MNNTSGKSSNAAAKPIQDDEYAYFGIDKRGNLSAKANPFDIANVDRETEATHRTTQNRMTSNFGNNLIGNNMTYAPKDE